MIATILCEIGSFILKILWFCIPDWQFPENWITAIRTQMQTLHWLYNYIPIDVLFGSITMIIGFEIIMLSVYIGSWIMAFILRSKTGALKLN